MNWDMITSSGIMTILSSGVIAEDNSHLHKKIEQLERWLFDVLNNCIIDLPEETYSALIQWKVEYIARKKKSQEERIACLKEEIHKMLDELKELQDES